MLYYQYIRKDQDGPFDINHVEMHHVFTFKELQVTSTAIFDIASYHLVIMYLENVSRVVLCVLTAST